MSFLKARPARARASETVARPVPARPGIETARVGPESALEPTQMFKKIYSMMIFENDFYR